MLIIMWNDGSRPGPNTRINERPSDTVYYRAEKQERERGKERERERERESGVSGFD